MNDILQVVKNEPVVSSLVIAEETKNQHKSIIQIIRAYSDDFNEFGTFTFQMRKSKGRPTQYALLNEAQATLLMTYLKNNDVVRKFKKQLVKAFFEMAHELRKRELIDTEYLPFYHDLHNSVKSLAGVAHNSGSKTPEKIFHINYNKMINKAFGLASNQRSDLLPEYKMLVSAANLVATRSNEKALADGKDHKEAYQIAKQDVQNYVNSVKASSNNLLI